MVFDAAESSPSSSDEPPRSRLARLIGIRGGFAVGGAVAMWIVAPEAVRATFSGPGPLLRFAGVFLVFGSWSFVVGRLVSSPWARRALVGLPVIAVAWWAITPYVTDDRVDEAFPVMAGPATPSASTSTSVGTAPVRDTPAVIPDVPPAPQGTPAPQRPPETSAPARDTAAGQASPPSSAAPAATEPTTSVTQVEEPPPPVATHAGSFQGLAGHQGSGTATVYELGDGSRVLRFEDFDVSNGPDLEVHLIPGADRRSPSGGVKIAELKGNVGNQNYELRSGLVLEGEWTVLIWCEAFVVEVANATLSAA